MAAPATAWTTRGNLRGPTGPTGPTGPAGADGGTTPHASRHAAGGSDPVSPASIGALAAVARGAASGVGSLTAAIRQPTSEAPIVKHQIRTGSVTSTVTSDAASGAGNLANLNINGTVTIVAPVGPVDWQEFEHHCVAVGADRIVSFTGGYVAAGASLGPYTIPRGKVLVAKSVYIGNRATAADVAAPAWALVSAAVTDAVINPLTGWVDARRSGLLMDGTTDETAAAQAILNATPAGGVCYLGGPGSLATSAPLVVPPNITLLTSHGDTLTYADALANPVSIKPLASFAGRAVLRLLDKTTGGYAAAAIGTRIVGLTVDGSRVVAGGVAGVELYGFVREATLDHVVVRNITGDGFATTGHGSYSGDARPPQSLRFLGCVADNNGGAGFVGSGTPDCTWIDCNAQGNDYVGFYIAGCQNGMLIGCRAEWSSQQNYYVTGGNWGTGQGSGGLMMFGCLSDRAGYDGIKIDSTGSAAHNITGFVARRDGRNNGTGGGGYAAITVAGATTPVIVTALTVYPGTDDDGAGTNSPQVGVTANNSTHVQVVSGYIHAATTPIGAGAGNGWFSVAPDVGCATGLTTAPVRLPMNLIPNSAVASKTANYTLVDTDTVVIFDTTSASMTATLPTAVGRTGRRFTVKKRGGSTTNMLTIASNGGTIDGLATEIISVSGGFRELISDGTNWHVVGGGVLPVIVALANVGAGGSIAIDASIGSVYRVTTTGSTAALAVPTNAIDGDVINVEVYASTVATTLTLNAAIIETGGLAASYIIAIGKVLHLALRFRNVAPTGWRLLAASPDN